MCALISNFKQIISYAIKMTSKVSIEIVKQNAEVAKRTIVELKNELNVLNTEYNKLRAEQLREENAKLLLAVDDAKKKLVDLETKNGVNQIPLPNKDNQSLNDAGPASSTVPVIKPVESVKSIADAKSVKSIADAKEVKSKKEKKPKENKEKNSTNADLPVDVGRLDLRIAKVEDVQNHPDADSLYVLKINCGEEKPRTVCSGLVKYVPMDQLRDRSVVLLCNLKPVKMRGITSEAMVMCASTPEAVEVLIPPENSLPGEFVECGEYTRQPDPVMNPKKKIFETVCPDLHTNNQLEACYKGTPFSVPGKGVILSKTLKNVAVK